MRFHSPGPPTIWYNIYVFDGLNLLVVFSHPNHELAIYGLLQRFRPNIIFLTDGGGPDRIRETSNSLESLNLLDRAIFLNHTEQSFYDGLLARNHVLFKSVAEEVRRHMRTLKPDRIMCDAIEFYNPVHDLTWPILASISAKIPIFEVPLIYQRPTEREEYGVQTAPASVTHRMEFPLTDMETASKRNALEHTYTILWKTLGPILLASPTALKKETIFPALLPLRWPEEDYVLRYDQRAEKLKEAGQVTETITHTGHFIPTVKRLIDR